MMKRFQRYLIRGFFFVLILGSLSHFFYQWSNGNFIIGLFCPVNESTWEHMKLAFFPILLYSVFLYIRFSSSLPCILYAIPQSILGSTALIPVIFYTYTGILGKNYFILDLLTFGLSIGQGFRILGRCSRKYRYSQRSIFLWILIFILTACFFVFSYMPPDLPLFKSP